MSCLALDDKKLKTLEGQNIPEVVDGFFACRDNKLTSLEFGPKEVSGDYYCGANKLTSLQFCATKIGDGLYVRDNSIENLKGIHIQFKNGYINTALGVQKNPLKSHILGVILIPRLQRVLINDNKVIHGIINRHLETGRDILECQEELIQNGLKEFAQL